MIISNKWVLIAVVVGVLLLSTLGYYIWYKDREAKGMLIPPKAPSELMGEKVSATQIKLKWEDNSYNESGFLLYRDDTIIVDVPSNTSSYIDANLRPATQYNYKIVAYNRVNNSDPV